jgi:tetratricopeptide (TPR) repeat protein
MTANHLLLYRLAELMLEHEQHILPVDLLFDDEQIGEFVKSIQIDSPYQQMLYEGVLTESVREEKLYVSFTVEGFFHYVLGQVIYNQTKGKSPETLKKIVEENKLNGAKEGVEQCLIRDVLLDDLSRLMWLIDEGGGFLDICSVPLASAFFIVTKPLNKCEGFNLEYSIKINNILNKLLANQTDNDIKVLVKTINYLNKNQQHILVSNIYIVINEIVKPNCLINASLFVKSIEYIPKDLRYQKLKDVSKSFKLEKDGKELSNFYSDLSNQYRSINNYEEALIFIEKSWKILGNIKGRNNRLRIKYYSSLGLIYLGLKNYSTSMEYFNKSLSLSKRIDGENSISIATLNNHIGIVCMGNKNYDLAIKYFDKALNLISKIFGSHNIKSSRICLAYATALIAKKEFEKAIEIYNTSISKEINAYGTKTRFIAFLYQTIGEIWYIIKDYDNTIIYYNQSLAIYLENEKDSKSEIVELLNKLGAIYLNKRKEFDLAIEKFEEALKINLNSHGKFHSSIAECLCNLGLSWKGNCNYEKAIAFLNESIEITLRNNEKTNKKLTLEYKTIAFCFCEIKEYDKSIEFYEKALKNDLEVSGETHLITGKTYKNLGSVWNKKENYQNAIEYYEKALKIDLEINGENQLITGTTYKNLASVWNKKRNYHNAIDCYEKFLKIKLQTHGEMDDELGYTFNYIGNLYINLNEYNEAIINFQKGFKILHKGGFPFKIAQCYEALIKQEKALDYYIKSAEIRKLNIGLKDKATQESIANAKRLAKELNKESELPEWMR